MNSVYGKMQKDLNETKNILVDAVSSLLERGETIEQCQKKSNILLEHSEIFDEKINNVVYANRLSKIFCEKIVPFLSWLWTNIKYYTIKIVWQEPCKIYFENSNLSVHLRVKEKTQQI